MSTLPNTYIAIDTTAHVTSDRDTSDYVTVSQLAVLGSDVSHYHSGSQYVAFLQTSSVFLGLTCTVEPCHHVV